MVLCNGADIFPSSVGLCRFLSDYRNRVGPTGTTAVPLRHRRTFNIYKVAQMVKRKWTEGQVVLLTGLLHLSRQRKHRAARGEQNCRKIEVLS